MWIVTALQGERFIVWDWDTLMHMVRQGVREVREAN